MFDLDDEFDRAAADIGRQIGQEQRAFGVVARIVSAAPGRDRVGPRGVGARAIPRGVVVPGRGVAAGEAAAVRLPGDSAAVPR